ncbi:hypothetical protein HZS_5013 [Henneguya salminicola]|nr:hypothetical protein HZS_5013 [Henneguya salminicola]
MSNNTIRKSSIKETYYVKESTYSTIRRTIIGTRSKKIQEVKNVIIDERYRIPTPKPYTQEVKAFFLEVRFEDKGKNRVFVGPEPISEFSIDSFIFP